MKIDSPEIVFYEPYTIWYHPLWYSTWFWVFFGLLLFVVVIAGIVRAVRSRWRSMQPWQQALHELKNLQEDVDLQNGTVKEFYSRLTDLFKKYGIARFNIDAHGVTDTEFVQKLKACQEFPQKLHADVDTMYEGVLMIKFGQTQSQKIAMKAAKSAAQRIVIATIPKKS